MKTLLAMTFCCRWSHSSFSKFKEPSKRQLWFFHIFDDTLILWRSNDENNTERLEPVELFLHALVRVTKDRHRKQQLSFVAPFNRVAAGDISNEWQSVVVDLEFSSDEAEKNSLTCIMQTMDRLGVPRPETNGVLLQKCLLQIPLLTLVLTS